jgi:hypothetical protein
VSIEYNTCGRSYDCRQTLKVEKNNIKQNLKRSLHHLMQHNFFVHKTSRTYVPEQQVLKAISDSMQEHENPKP